MILKYFFHSKFHNTKCFFKLIKFPSPRVLIGMASIRKNNKRNTEYPVRFNRKIIKEGDPYGYRDHQSQGE
jgi:hypothetical protein